MKTFKKVIKLLALGVVVIFLGIMLFGYYLEQTKCVALFQSSFVGKDIVFPMTIKEATKKYNLVYDSIGIRGMTLSEKDTLMIADTRGRSSDVYGLVFYLRGISKEDIATLQKSLEKQYEKKFEKPSFYGLFQYMKINDCVYILVEHSNYATNRIFKTFSDRQITCRVGFYYGLSEDALIQTSEDGHLGIIGRGYGGIE